jgi:hypothetical protein
MRAGLRTARDVDFHIGLTLDEHSAALGAITLSVDVAKGGPFRMQDYLTPEEAFNLASMLTTAAMKVEETDSVEQDLPS